MYENEDSQRREELMLKLVTGGKMNLNISLQPYGDRGDTHILHSLWVFAIQPPWRGAAVKIIEPPNT